MRDEIKRRETPKDRMIDDIIAVSYTHLTLPTT